MRGKQLVVACVVLCALTVLLPVYVQAADSCKCFCTSDIGAADVGNFKTNEECHSACQANNQQMLSCATTYAQYPSSNVRCFTQDACFEAIANSLDQQVAGTGDVSLAGSFSILDGYQPPECLQGSGYCYPPQRYQNLSVSLGGVGKVSGLSDYISQAYQTLLGIALTISIVMVMIGGLQYVLAAGSGSVGQAKERIVNAVTGLVLLFSAYVILYTVNPNLVSLRLPQFPMIRPVVLVGDESCDDLEEKGYELDTENIQNLQGDTVPYAEAWCGTSTAVLKDGNGNQVPDGTTCQFKQCKGAPEKGCLISGGEAKCVSCTEIYGAGLATAGSDVAPSTSVCSQLKLDDADIQTTPPTPDERNFCFYTHDPGVIVSGWDVAALASVPLTAGLTAGIVPGVTADTVQQSINGTCAEISLDCTKITKCEDYGSQPVVSGFTTNQVKDLSLSGVLGSPVNFQTLCQQDPCAVAEKIGMDRCVFGYYNTSLSGYELWSTAACVGQ